MPEGECNYKIVYIPAEISEPLQQWELSSSRERLVESLLDRLKEHFAARSPQKTAAQLKRQHQELLSKLPAGTNVDERMLHIATSMQMVENIALLSNAPEYSFVGVNMYVDDEGSIKQLPLNLRASDIASCCAKPMEVRGDAFLSRVMDNGDDFDRMDLLVPEVSSTAPWVRDAAAQNRKKQASSSPDQLKAQLLHSSAAAAIAKPAAPERRLPPPPPRTVSPAEQAKAAGNGAFAAKNYAEAVQQYSKALELDPQLVAALNNRALCHLKLEQWAAAEADANSVLALQPSNVKALLRRANAREAMKQSETAAADYLAVFDLEPHNKEAVERLQVLAPVPDDLGDPTHPIYKEIEKNNAKANQSPSVTRAD